MPNGNNTQQLATEKIDIGPGYCFFGEDNNEPQYIGRTLGETEFSYEIETSDMETEEDGVFDQLIQDDAIVVTVPVIYTDKSTLSLLIPWSKLVEHGANDSERLIVPKAVGHRLSEFAEELIIRPKRLHDEDPDDPDKSKDITVHRAYPIPGPLNFSYSREGQRIANIEFAALPASDSETIEIAGETEEVYSYFSVGDTEITGTET